ncbi:apoptosis inducing factor mitochondria associated 4 [Boleophthalmus pectinirostris]|uniref:apoptosis inducing factor mitochondria associated 4 n=1 Tax=Boleophthalmus pectinirostris TaxID=150288 RepID=UPI00242DDAE6|nr:apoptosis inducing factor mitochondria associated 4 [Boleophthalmus pectinirostris]XP_055003885.1 apoptosis inducing factor mitochondria associated 4 [Boleophthalmus pectinirostris]XP_055003887.1 apoptosis inducing factor mitochondria associated 4 [Boleophthalmus pectinirostris]XP_055003888.1 apoptosis inducing factor mitochondria associated 4 [Boleophthalmus pectinirostris]XP_055003889.1 apoptosis inducing factor mitochondria associated 4 [Boleophthalmus pectinirostris]XP_055003890.1 apopt
MEACQEPGPDGFSADEMTSLVCQEDDLKDGEMKAVEVGDAKVLLVRTRGQYTAIGSKCSHYGAPLIKGVLVGDRVRCPFHGACFNVKTGDIEDYPGLDSLPCYKVTVTNGQVYVTINKKTMMQTKRVKEMCSVTPDLKHTIVLIGGGPASLVCAETLRQNNYKGRIIMITKDSLPPFDKPKLSKAMNEDSNNLLLRSRDFFHEFGIDLWTQKEVISVNTADKVMKLSDDSLQPYDQLLIATGCRARPLSCPGWDLEGVMLLQSYKDAKEIHTLSVGRKAVVIGTSFIGMEAASYLSNKAASVAVVGTSVYPFERSLGREIGQMTMQMLEEHSVKFYMKSGVSEIRGHNGKVKEVVLKDGQVLEADVVILGIGVIPNSDFLQGSGVEIDSRKAVIVNKLMMTNAPDVFSAGDVTAFPLTIRRDQIVSIGHWQMSHAHGRVAALNMLKKTTEMKSIPFFWTVLLGKSIRYTGYNEGYTEIIFKGTVAERKFLAFYIKDDVVVAAASLMFDPAVAHLAEMMALGQCITKAQALADDLSWQM